MKSRLPSHWHPTQRGIEDTIQQTLQQNINKASHSPAHTHSPSQKLLDGGSAFAAIVRPDEGETAAVRGEKEARAT